MTTEGASRWQRGVETARQAIEPQLSLRAWTENTSHTDYSVPLDGCDFRDIFAHSSAASKDHAREWVENNDFPHVSSNVLSDAKDLVALKLNKATFKKIGEGRSYPRGECKIHPRQRTTQWPHFRLCWGVDTAPRSSGKRRWPSPNPHRRRASSNTPSPKRGSVRPLESENIHSITPSLVGINRIATQSHHHWSASTEYPLNHTIIGRHQQNSHESRWCDGEKHLDKVRLVVAVGVFLVAALGDRAIEAKSKCNIVVIYNVAPNEL
eukprot:1190541-Prorocentrum_minimum.AAC.3